MTKLNSAAITSGDLQDFVAHNSDFDFEMKVLAQLRSLDFECQHSGTYQDPVTDKIRQFDIRASKSFGSCTLALAIECKNLRANCPLLLSAVPRTTTESTHDLLLVRKHIGPGYPSVETMSGADSAYKEAEMVGKKTDQVGRLESSKELVSDDEATFNKLNQAVNSCRDVVRNLRRGPNLPLLVSAIVPVLVVPDGMLWQVDYDKNGGLRIGPRKVDRTTLYYGHSWEIRGDNVTVLPITYTLSHIEVVTFGALTAAVTAWTGPLGFFLRFRD